MLESVLVTRDLKHIWHPCSQMKDYEIFKPLVVTRANGSYIELANGQKIIDAISSWWCKSLGHNQPRLKNALLTQVNHFEHVMLGNITYEVITLLSEKLCNLTQSLHKVFYASDGSSAVEIALKMSLHSRQIRGELNKTKFIALENGYHGETTGALSVSDLGLYKKPYQSLLFDVYYISPLPYLLSSEDLLWQNCHEHWTIIENKLNDIKENITAVILEPIVQGAAGMKIYSQNFLYRLRAWTLKNNIHLIADEIMTGIGRTGKLFAYQHANIEPDFLCLGKGLAAGWLPLSAVLTSNKIYQHFYDDYKTGKSFLHSHTYSGNALAASVALEVLNMNEELNFSAMANRLGVMMFAAMQEVAQITQKIHNIRCMGAIVAADLICQDSQCRLGFEFYQHAVKFGALLRPLGNTIYWFPPLNIELETLEQLKAITIKALHALHT